MVNKFILAEQRRTVDGRYALALNNLAKKQELRGSLKTEKARNVNELHPSDK